MSSTHRTTHTTGQSKIARDVIIGQNRIWLRLGLGGRGSRLPLWPIASGEGRSAPPASPRPGPHIAHAAPSTGSRYSLPIPRQALVADDEDGYNVCALRHRKSASATFLVMRHYTRMRGWVDAAASRGVVLSGGVGAPRYAKAAIASFGTHIGTPPGQERPAPKTTPTLHPSDQMIRCQGVVGEKTAPPQAERTGSRLQPRGRLGLVHVASPRRPWCPRRRRGGRRRWCRRRRRRARRPIAHRRRPPCRPGEPPLSVPERRSSSTSVPEPPPPLACLGVGASGRRPHVERAPRPECRAVDHTRSVPLCLLPCCAVDLTWSLRLDPPPPPSHRRPRAEHAPLPPP